MDHTPPPAVTVALTEHEVATRSEHPAAERGEHSPATVDPRDEPSREWGWHGGFPRGSVIAGWVAVAILLVIMVTARTDNEGRIPDIYLGATSLAMILLLIRHTLRDRHPWRR